MVEVVSSQMVLSDMVCVHMSIPIARKKTRATDFEMFEKMLNIMFGLTMKMTVF